MGKDKVSPPVPVPVTPVSDKVSRRVSKHQALIARLKLDQQRIAAEISQAEARIAEAQK